MDTERLPAVLPLISPSSVLRMPQDAITGPFDFRFHIHRISGALLLLPESDEGLLQAVREARHREPEGHVEACVDLIVKALVEQKLGTEGIRACGLSDKDRTLAEALGRRLNSEVPILFPGRHVLEIEQSVPNCPPLASKQKVDLLVARHLIEHLRDVDSFLEWVRSLTSDTSMVLIEVPDSSKIFSEGDLTQMWEEHTGYFTHDTLVRLLRAHSFEILRQEAWTSDGEDVFVLLIRPASETFNPPPERRFDDVPSRLFVRKLPEMLETIRAKLNERSLQRHLWMFGANHASGFFLDAISDSASLFCGVMDDDPQKIGKRLGVFETPVYEPGFDLAGGPLNVIVAINEGRAPGLYNRMEQLFPDSSGHRIESLSNFLKGCWEGLV